MNPIDALSKHILKNEVYHADGHGHVQVETVSTDDFESPTDLLEKIDQTSQWPAFYAMARTKPEQWLLGLMGYFPETKPYSTRCFVEFLDIFSSRNAMICLVQESPRWYWDVENIEQIGKVMSTVTSLIDSTSQGDLDAEIDLMLLGDLLKRLNEIQVEVMTG